MPAVLDAAQATPTLARGPMEADVPDVGVHRAPSASRLPCVLSPIDVQSATARTSAMPAGGVRALHRVLIVPPFDPTRS